MDLTRIAQEVLGYLAAEGIELSDDLGATEEMLREQMLRIGVKYNRIVTAEPEIVGKTRGRMNGDERLLVYKKQSCSSCGQRIASWSLGGRLVYACLRCQSGKRPAR